MITIIDYGMGNLRSVQKAVELFASKVKISGFYKDVLRSDKVILPGVGAFGKAMEELDKRGLRETVLSVVSKGKPFMGICLGMQLLFSDSEEADGVKGLDILKGRVKRFANVNGLKIPHMGWNEIRIGPKNRKSKIFQGIKDRSYMYFVHSYFVNAENDDAVLCKTEYGNTFVSGIQKDNIYAFQFHPEKSQTSGLRIIENFAKL